jgi:hypothetical protein
MSSSIDDFIKSGRRLITDTKAVKVVTERPKVNGKPAQPSMTDAHERFVNRVIKDKPPVKEIIEDIKRFIQEAEAKL